MALAQSTFIQNAATGTTCVVTPTTTPANGNTGLIVVSQSSNGSGTATCPGFSAVPGLSLVTLPSSGNFLSVLQKNLGASEPSSYTVTVNGGSISNQITLTYLEFSGRATSPFVVTPTKNTVTTATHPLSCPATGLTANSGDDILYIVTMGNFGVPMTFTAPSGFTTAQNASGGTASQVSAATAVKANVSAGGTGTVTGTENWSGASTDAGMILISLAAAPAASLAASPLSFAYTLNNATLESLRVVATAFSATRGNPVSATLTAAQSTGVIAVEVWGNTNPGTITVTDTVNGSYAQIGTTFFVSGAGYCAAFWVQTTGSGTPVITATNTNSVGSGIGAINITGFKGTPVIDTLATLTASNTGSTTTISETVVSNFNNEVLFATINETSFISGEPSGWVEVGTTNFPPYYNIQQAPASVPFNATFGSATGYAFLNVGIYDSTSPILAANPLSFALTLESATLAAGGALSLAATNLSFAYTLESATLPSGSILAAANLAFAYTLEPDNFTYSTANFEFLMAPMTFFVDMGIELSAFQLDFTPLGWQLTIPTNALVFFSNSPYSMPDLVGLLLQEALQVLEEAGILVPSAIGYFGTYPIKAIWGPGKPSGYVTAQSIAVGQSVVPNSAITLTVNEFRTGVVFPAGGGSIA